MDAPLYFTNHLCYFDSGMRCIRACRPSIATVYAPICYGPLPLLAFKVDVESGKAELAATGTLRSCDPDRVVLKKIVLSGYPVRVSYSPYVHTAWLPCCPSCSSGGSPLWAGPLLDLPVRLTEGLPC